MATVMLIMFSERRHVISLTFETPYNQTILERGNNMLGKRKGSLKVLIVVFVLLWSFSTAASNLPGLPQLELPALVTACGQSPDYGIVELLAKRAEVPVQVDPMLEPDGMDGAKTLILVLGGSGKGLGAAGIDAPAEMARVDKLIEKARKSNVFILVMHIGGEERRGPNSAQFVTYAEAGDYLIVRESGNADGYFTDISRKHNIPLYSIEKNMELVDILGALFLPNQD